MRGRYPGKLLQNQGDSGWVALRHPASVVALAIRPARGGGMVLVCPAARAVEWEGALPPTPSPPAGAPRPGFSIPTDSGLPGLMGLAWWRWRWRGRSRAVVLAPGKTARSELRRRRTR